ncbi:hypothetical protein AO377_1807 [Moraxella catarrhalis]|nr:hypothetical protein AO377_1807 [Moraxella catarrhalis]OAV14174.1 hypothetical protein AO375_1289 [Moraxella catarrhalis]OAV34236.1 hypothetical protein AO365_1456 [Moraxella catarrhalis]
MHKKAPCIFMVLFYILDLNDENTSASEQYFLLNIRKSPSF